MLNVKINFFCIVQVGSYPVVNAAFQKHLLAQYKGNVLYQ